jgi:TonB family protein
MKHLFSTAAFLLFVFVFVNVVPAQDVPKIIKGGVLNGKATSLPKPAYPEEAKAAKLSGTVKIKVIIDEEGNVESAEPSEEVIRYSKSKPDGSTEEGELQPADPILVEAARSAALLARFSPTRLSGVPVKVSGVITYNFVSEGPVALKMAPKSEVLNGKAILLPNPEYPPAAKAVKATGVVMVQVTVDENGDVISAAAVSGHPLLRSAAMSAAREAKFEPTYVNGSAVNVTGHLTYNFALPD